MARWFLAAMVLCFPVVVMAADDYKVSQLEQDVRDLQRQVQTQVRQIEELQAQLVRPADRSLAPVSPGARPTGHVDWLDASKWQALKPGMNEMEVISALGPPTSMRANGKERVLLYAMEIGTSGFLGGSVTLHDRAVVEVQKPVLR